MTSGVGGTDGVIGPGGLFARAVSVGLVVERVLCKIGEGGVGGW